MMGDQPNEIEPERLRSELPPERVEKTIGAEEDNASEFPVVGIGASAGGLAAFEQFFSSLSPDTGLAYVVIQHLSAPHKSILPEILQRYTPMPVQQVTDGIRVQPNYVYVIPPGNNLVLMDGHLVLLKPSSERGYRFPIDLFFGSLAEARGNSAIGIVLSGTANDGSLGIKHIKAMGGLTIAQDPNTAGFGDMPSNAIATQDVDFIVSPEKMGELILKYIRHQPTDEYQAGDGNPHVGIATLQQLYSHLRAKTGHDFSLYKQNTMLRRIERRIKITLVPDLAAYINYLRQHPEEIDALFRDLLINVTQFFRDPEAFDALVEKAIQPMIVSKYASQVPLRIWVAGCSSGEEPYSIAIALMEQCEALKVDCKVQIYATDLDGEAIAIARKGVYSDGSLEHVTPERLQRFFIKNEEGYQIKKNIRDLVVFSTQNVIFDPPFSKMDLLCCRNLLIYLEPDLQKQLFPVFHYALNTGGVLFLGTSESIGGFTELFSVIDRKNKIYRRKDNAAQHLLHTRVRSATGFTLPGVSDTIKQQPGTGGLREWTEQALLKYHAPACVLVNAKHEILYVHGRTGKYLEPSTGEASMNVLRMAREGLKAELATAIHAAADHKETVSRQGIQVKTNGDYQSINLTVRPVDMAGIGQDLLMVVFEEAQGFPVEPTPADAKRRKNHGVDELEKALKQKDDYLNSIINELEEANQDLKSVNEEMQSSYEEMQSTNEEMETSREELQSINEELSTVNAELQNKNVELTGLNNDVYNLLASTEIGTIFLDLDLQVRRYTPAVQSIYNFLPGDVGRPISHFHSTLQYDHLVDDIQEVLSTLIPKAVEAQSKDELWYLVNIRPYRTLENMIDGAVITFVDITEQKQSEGLRRLATVIRDANDAITVQDFEGRILAWNQGAEQMYGWREAEALTMNSLDLVPEYLRAETTALYQRLFKGEKIRSFETRRMTRSGSTIDVWVTLSLLVNDQNLPVGIAATERDITEWKLSDQQLRFEIRSLKVLNSWLTRYNNQVLSPSLWKEVCRMLIEEGGYRLAWMGQVEDDQADILSPVGWAGIEKDSSPSKEVDYDPIDDLARRSQKSAKNALQSRQPQVFHEILDNPSCKSIHTDALKYGYNSLIVLPLALKSRALGVLAIYAAEPEAFIDQEMHSLILLSEHIAQKLDSG